MDISIRVHKLIGVLTAIMFATGLVLFIPSPAYAATTWTVTDASDTAGSAADITLRYAMTNAQSGDTINFADSVIGQSYYTTDGSDPVTSNTRKAYNGLIPVSQTETIKVVNHTSAGWSAVTTVTFNIGGTDSPREPMIFPYEGSFTGPQTVYIYGAGASSLYYTTDGSDPGTSSTRTTYQGEFTSITVSQSGTVKVIAEYGSSGSSNVASATFTIGGTASLTAPVITPNGGNFSGPIMVDIYNRPGTIYLSSPLPKINKDLTIDGPGAESLSISGNYKSRVFEVDGGNVSISGIIIENGFVRGNSGFDGYNGIAGGGGGGGGAAEGGGGLLVKGGTLTIDGVGFLYNKAVGGPGGYGGAGYTGSDDYGDGGSGASSDLLDNSAGGQGGIAPFAAVNFGIFELSSDRPGSDASDGLRYGGGGGGSGINSDNEPSGYSVGGQGGQDASGTNGTGPNGVSYNTNGSKGGNGGSGGAASVTGGYYYGGNGGNGGDAYGGAISVINGFVQILNSSFTGNSAVGGMGGAGGISYQGMSNGQSLDSFIYSIGGTLLSGNRGDFESGSLAWFVDFGLSRAGSAFNFEAKTSTAYPFGGYPGNGGNGEGGAIYVSPYNGSFGFNGAPVVIVNSTFADNGAYGGLPGPKTDWTGLSGSYGQHSADDIANKTNSAHVAVRNVTGVTSTLGDIRTLSGPSALFSVITAGSQSVTADGTASTTITVSLRDLNNMPVWGDRVTLNQGNGHSNISPASAYTDSDGNAVFTVTDTRAESVAYTVTDETNITLSGKPLQIWDGYQNVASTESTVTYTPGPASAEKSTVSASPSTVFANDIDTATVTVTLKDAGGNPLSGKTVILNEGSGNSIIIPQNNGITDANGAATFTVTDNRAETVTYTAKDTTDNVTITQTAVVTFTAHAVNAAQSGVSVDPQSVFADGLAYSTITVTLRDASGNPVSGKTVSLNQGTGNSIITPQNNGITDANGAATFIVTDNRAETVTYTAKDITDNVTITQTAVVTFTPHNVSTLNSYITVNPGSVLADGLAYSTITVTLRDANGNPVRGKAVSLNQGTGNSKITPQNNGITDANGTATFTVTDTRVESVTYIAIDISDNVTVSRTGDLINSSPAIVNFVPSTRIVSTTSDDGSSGTLRYAMQNAPMGLTITFQSGLTGIITLQSPLPDINRDLTIDGTGANVTISGNNQYRVFLVSGANVTLKGLTIADGMAEGSNGSDGTGGGLNIYGGTVYIDNVTFNNNNATGGYGASGGWGMSTGGNGGNGWGGAVFLNNGSLTVTNSSFTDNQAVGGVGGTGYYGGNGGNGEGGAVFVVEGSLTVTNSSFTGNNVIGGSGGGGFNSGNSGSALGSSIYNLLGTVALSDVTHDPGSNSLYNLSTINTVTFDSQGGSPVSSISNSSVSTISEPAAPTRTGYSFGGWYKEADYTNEWNFSTDTVTGDITLYAKWTIQTHTATFKDWDGTVLKTETLNYGAGATAPGNPTRTDYTFTGWDVDFSNVTSDLTVTAQYSQNPVTYTVTYNSNGGTGTAPTETAKAAEAAFAAAANNFTAPSGRQFKEWNTNAGGTGTGYAARATVTMPASNLTLYAIWEDIPAVTLSSIVITTPATKLSYNVGDPLDISGMVVTSTYSDNSTKTESITAANITGFDSSAPAASQTLTVTVGGKKATYTIEIKAAVTAHTVTFKDWNGTVLKTQTVNDKAAATAPADPSRTSYFFTGWDISFSNVTSDLTVTAQYSQNPLSLTLSPDNGVAGDIIGFFGKTTTSSAVMVKVVKADGTEVYSRSLNSDASGNFSGSFNVPNGMASGLLYGSAQTVGRKVTANVFVHEANKPYVPPVVIITPTVTVSNDGSNKKLELPATVLTTSSAIKVTIPAAVNDATISVAKMVNTPVGGVVTTQPLPAMNIEAITALSSSPVKVNMPAEVTISAPTSSNWDGTINVPAVKPNNTVSVSVDIGKTATVNTVIEVGYGNVPLTFNKAVRLLIPGMAGKDAGYIRNGNFTKITKLLSADSQSIADAEITDGGDARIDVGSDMVIWTKHFTSFVAYTQTSNSQNNTTSSGGGGSNSNPQLSAQIAVDANGNVSMTVSPTLNQNTGTAFAQVDTATLTKAFAKVAVAGNGIKTVVIELPKVAGAKAYETTLPAGFLASGAVTNKVEIKNDIAGLTVPGNMLAAASAAGIQNVSLTIASADKNNLNTAVQAQLGNRPIIELNLKVDGQQTPWSNTAASITVTIPYTPTVAERRNPESIVIWYIDGSGKAVTIPNSQYNPSTGTIIFRTTHFSYYAVGYEPVKRLAGTDRIDTALTIAKATYTGKITNVILATTNNYPDALAGSVLAQKLNAPILLVGSTDEDQTKVLNYLKENMGTTGNVYILGGTAAVSAAMEEKVQANGYQNIKRIGGYNAYETAANITDALQVETGTPVVLVSGRNYADALSISSIAAMKQYPILLVNQDGIPESVQNELQKIKPEKVYIIGLQGALSPEIEKQVASLTKLPQTDIIRIGGIDKYATSREVGKYFSPKTDILCVATGNNFPDALTGSIYAASRHAPIMLVDKTLSAEEVKYLQDIKTAGVTIFGGTAVVSQALENQLSQLFGQ